MVLCQAVLALKTLLLGIFSGNITWIVFATLLIPRVNQLSRITDLSELPGCFCALNHLPSGLDLEGQNLVLVCVLSLSPSRPTTNSAGPWGARDVSEAGLFLSLGLLVWQSLGVTHFL